MSLVWLVADSIGERNAQIRREPLTVDRSLKCLPNVLRRSVETTSGNGTFVLRKRITEYASFLPFT